MLIPFGYNRKQYPTYCQSGDGHRQINLIPGLDFLICHLRKMTSLSLRVCMSINKKSFQNSKHTFKQKKLLCTPKQEITRNV